MSATPVIAWLTCGAKRQLENFAHEQHLPAERVAGELVTEGLLRLGVPPAPMYDVQLAERRRAPPGEEVVAAFQAGLPRQDAAAAAANAKSSAAAAASMKTSSVPKAPPAPRKPKASR